MKCGDGKENAMQIAVLTVTAFGGGSIMVWGGISVRVKTDLIIEGNLTAVSYRDDIMEPVVIPYLQNMAPNAILQDDNTCHHRAQIIEEYFQNLEVKRME